MAGTDKITKVAGQGPAKPPVKNPGKPNTTGNATEKPAEEEKPDTKKTPSRATSNYKAGNLTSPEGILMLCVAGILDIVGFMLLLASYIGVDDYGILDIIGIIIIGGWLFVSRGTDGIKKILPKFLLALGFESVPFLGSASPSWILFVYSVLKND